MADYSMKLKEKLELIRGSFDKAGIFNRKGAGCEKVCAAFISVCSTTERATVLRGAGSDPAQAWERACENALEYVRKQELVPVWVKADIASSAEAVPFGELLAQIEKSRSQFFRRGISFDDGFGAALTEAEINGNRVITYKKHTLELKQVNKYLASCGMKTLSGFPESVLLFDCDSRFCGDDGAVLELYGSGNDCGRRVLREFTDKTALEVISTSSDFLSMQERLDGSFDYGFYPLSGKPLPGYNILRHSGTIWSLCCAYRLTGDRFMLDQIKGAIGFMIANTFKKYPDREGELNTVYLAEKTQNEVKLGGNAMAVIALTEYMNVTGSDKYARLCRELGNGILELFDQRDGSFFHVLNFPSLSPKDGYRTVYYDGEATFALARLYGLTREKKWLDAAKRSADRFIREKYEQYRDHWVGYSINELTKYCPEDRYLSFGLKNVNVNLDRIYRQDTTYHTYLELLCGAFELYDRIVTEGLSCSYLGKFRTKRFVETIWHRAEYMLNGYGYPEYVMYFRRPEASLGAFFVRHDSYRVRIDDIQHFCSAYYSFYRNYDRLKALRDSLNPPED